MFQAFPGVKELAAKSVDEFTEQDVSGAFLIGPRLAGWACY
jgi:hypothetical protein